MGEFSKKKNKTTTFSKLNCSFSLHWCISGGIEVWTTTALQISHFTRFLSYLQLLGDFRTSLSTGTRPNIQVAMEKENSDYKSFDHDP